MKRLLLIALVLLLVSVTPTTAITPTISYNQSDFMPNSTAYFMQMNVSNINFTADDLFMVAQFPFPISKNHTVLENYTIFNFTTELPPYIAPNIYTGTLYLTYLDDTMTVPFNLSVGEQELWNINNETVNLTVNVSQEYLLPIKVNNLGNMDMVMSINLSGNCTNYTVATQDKVCYPELDNELLLTFDIPDDYRTVIETCNVMVYNNDNHSDNQTFNITMNISDNINPKIDAEHIYDSMALKTNKFILTVSDNAGISNVTGILQYENLSVWYDNGTRFESLDNVTVANVIFKNLNGVWTYDFEDTELLGKYHLSYEVMDTSNNTVEGYAIFYIEELDCLFYDKMIEGTLMRQDSETEENLLSSEFDIPLKITLVSVKDVKSGLSADNFTNDTYRVGIKDFSGDRQYFDSQGDIIEIDGTGSAGLLFTANYLAQFVVILQVETVEQHIPIDNITFIVQTLDYAPPFEHYESPQLVSGAKWSCDLDDADRVEDICMDCHTRICGIHALSEENLAVLRPLSIMKAELEVWESRIADKDEKIAAMQNWLLLVSVVSGLLLLNILFDRFARPFIVIVG